MRNKIVRIILSLLFILLIDLFLLKDLFFSQAKLFITPEFYGGDFFTVELPLQKINCQYVKNSQIPFWSKNISFGYPLLAEGQIGFFNPINFFTCKFFDYKNVFKLQFLIHLYLGQVGNFLLANFFGLSFFSSIFFSFLFFFSPFLIMNWMHTTMVYPFSYLPWLFLFFLIFLKEKKIIFYFLFILTVFFQFICAHHQSFFISSLFILFFFLFYFKKNKDYFKFIFLLFFAYLLGIFLAAFQLIPLIEFLKVSNREGGIPLAALYDQNLTLKNLLTLINPKFFGWVDNGSYQFFKVPDPWEGIIFIYYIGLFFLLISLIKYKNKFIKLMILLTILFFLLALGKNSPIYLIHYLPIFSSFRFPTRYLFIVVFLLSLLSSFGVEFILKKIKKFLFLKVLIISILIFEINYFIKSFHITFSQKNLYINSFSFNWLKNGRYFIPSSTFNYLDQIYIKKGYQKKYLYYQFANDFLLGNISAVYDIQSFNNKFGPQIKRYIYYYGLIQEEFNQKDKTISFDKISLNLINLAGINYLLTVYPIKNDQFYLIKKKDFKDYSIFIYQNKKSFQRLQFYDNYQKIETFFEFKKLLEKDNLNFILLEKDQNWHLEKNKKIQFEYKILDDKDNFFKLETKTNKNTFLVLSDTYYPGWHVYIDNQPKEILKANLIFRGVYLPKGKHWVVFKYLPDSFYLGTRISIVTFFFLIILFLFLKFAKRLIFF